MEKTIKELKHEILRQKKLIDLGEQVDYNFSEFCTDDIMDSEVLKYFIVVDGKSYDFVKGNNKLKSLCEIMQ
jgi:hypothetical protein